MAQLGGPRGRKASSKVKTLPKSSNVKPQTSSYREREPLSTRCHSKIWRGFGQGEGPIWEHLVPTTSPMVSMGPVRPMPIAVNFSSDQFFWVFWLEPSIGTNVTPFVNRHVPDPKVPERGNYTHTHTHTHTNTHTHTHTHTHIYIYMYMYYCTPLPLNLANNNRQQATSNKQQGTSTYPYRFGHCSLRTLRIFCPRSHLGA